MSSAYPNPQEKLENSQIFLRWWPQLTALLLVFVELMWILPWFTGVTQITTTAKWWTAGLILGGIMLSAYAIGYLMESLRLIKNIQLVVMAGFLLLGLAAAENMLLKQPFESVPGGLMKLDPGAILVLFFVIWMWWRGLSLSKGDIRPMVAWRRFELGLLLFMGYILIAARTGFILPGMEVFFLFLFSGLLAGIFARISYVAIVKGIQKNPFDLRWSISVTAILGITVSTAVMIGGILGGQYRMVLDYLGEGLKLAIAAAIFLVGIPGLLITYFLSPIIPWFRSLFAERPNISTPDPASEALRRMIPWQDEVPNLSLNLQAVCFWGLVLFALVFLIFRLRRRLGANRLFDPGEPESLLKQGEARKLLVKSLQDGMMGLMMRLSQLAGSLQPLESGEFIQSCSPFVTIWGSRVVLTKHR